MFFDSSVYYECAQAGSIVRRFQRASDGIDEFQIFAAFVFDSVLLSAEHDGVGSHAAVYIIERLRYAVQFVPSSWVVCEQVGLYCHVG